MIRPTLLSSVAVAALSAGTANAQSLGAPRTPVAVNWTGSYAGLLAGASWGFNRWTDVNAAYGPNNSNYNSNPMGVAFGVFAGHNWQLSQNFVVGLEADLTYSTANGTAVVLPTWAWIHGHANFAGSLRARAGYAIDRALFYVTGGLAFGNPSQIRTDLLNNPNIGARYDGFRIGYALGAGVEYMASQAWTVRLEALYYGFGSARPTDLLNAGYVYTAQSSQLQVRVGAAYRF